MNTYTDVEIVDNVPYTRPGVNMLPGARCPHGVVDGDKPFTAAGPRCKSCLATWYAIEKPSEYYAGQTDYFCNTCGEKLHMVYFIEDGKTTPHMLAHDAPRGCVRSEFPIPGHEERYRFYGFGRFSEYLEELWARTEDSTKRDTRFKKMMQDTK